MVAVLLIRGWVLILSFHDSPDELFAPENQLDLVKELEAQKICRFKVLKEKE